ncbi:polysaccharide lyase 6 family protein [Alteromonas sp. C1M14]|uniref:polysaccharide lyase 6 family protein n=1 Tax=Alteromonas sp. C1M14 TaxID=2841567 RepID=UPI001C091509|nr:polysaccharide lyase 6 family protein [Alteromonas sp. C1M14]MBU2978134.1 polysaccharide lyase 6 family protein [Alteromonas sp. C1M14]
MFGMPRLQIRKSFIALLLLAFHQVGMAQIVKNIDQFNAAVKQAKAGDTIVMANGEWHDVELVLTGSGTEENPITLKAQTPGKVKITGVSNLSFSGEYLVVDGLFFTDGHTPTGEVIAFRTSPDDLANHSRLTNTVIDNFSHPERELSDLWVAIYGKHNRIDHNSFINKRNRGVTVAVRMNSEGSRKNYHTIEYNYFGPRQVLGANGGETLRIGTSHFSREYANTLVQYNYFDRTSGEHEIISNKSSGNTFKGNVFFEAQGTLTMRHGHYTTVENNYFLGNRKPNTGGIRIINEHQTVKNNYLYGLTGRRFRGALVIMNGVPNSPPNRYDPVIESVMNNNLVIDSDYIQLGAGADEERSAPPTTSEMKNNIMLGKQNLNPITVFDDVSGIEFSGNVLNEDANNPIGAGFKAAPYAIHKNENGLYVPEQSLLDAIDFGEVKLPVEKADTGAPYYPKKDHQVAFNSGKTIAVKPGIDTLAMALANSSAGDTLVLENGGDYLLTRFATVHHPITIMAKAGDKPMIRSEKPSFIVIENGGALEVENLWFDGAASPDYKGNSIIRTSRYSMNINYALSVKNVKVTDLDINGYFYFFKAHPGTFADYIEIIDSQMSNITGAVLSLNKETEDLGVYSVENLTLTGNTFKDIKEEVATVYRGGFDESTFGPKVTITDNLLTNVGKGKTHRTAASMYFHGVQNLHISNTTIKDSAPISMYLTNGEPITVLDNLQLINTPNIKSNSDDYTAKDITYQ